MPNRLIHANSPYLLQHANNPVDWYEWGDEALQRAKTEDKPIFLSIGYAACHWCHVMEHESFEDEATAALMNKLFVNIKVDREERPDLDGIYMTAVTAMTGRGGWPMSVFLTPDLKPFYGGTYFPPTRRYNMPAFQDVLRGVAGTWKNDRQNVLDSGDQLSQHLQNQIWSLGNGNAALTPDTLETAATKLGKSYDWRKGGWGRAPKFPQPMTIAFLLRRATRGDSFALHMATHALDAMALGGMYDVVGGGFARYSVDDEWLVPHFEKMLYDNAQLAGVYLHAYKITGKPTYRRICEETLAFIERELTHPDGGFFSSLDADSEGVEGKFYVWTPADLTAALPNAADAQFITAAYNLTEAGNFEGNTVLQRALDDAQLAEQFELNVEEIPPRLEALHAQMRAYRAKRTRPATDDKVLTAWNAMMLWTFAEAGRYLQNEHYTKMATRNASFLLSALHPHARLLRSWRDGKAAHNAYLDDYAMLILALLSLYQTDPNPRWFVEAKRLTEDMQAHFSDPSGGFFDTRDDHETLLLRPKDLQDNAVPSGNALATMALLQMAAFTGNGTYRALAERSLSALQNALAEYPTAFGQWLCAYDFALGPVREVAIVGTRATRSPLEQTVWAQYQPRVVLASAPVPTPPGSPPLLDHRNPIDGQAAAYVCEEFVCQHPVTDPKALQEQLKE